MSEPTSDDVSPESDGNRTRVRKRPVRGAAADPFAVTDSPRRGKTVARGDTSSDAVSEASDGSDGSGGADADEGGGRSRRRRRRGRGRGGSKQGAANRGSEGTDSGDTSSGDTGSGNKASDDKASGNKGSGAAGSGDTATDDAGSEDSSDASAATDSSDDAAAKGGSSGGKSSGGGRSSSRRRRGRRGRGRRGKGGSKKPSSQGEESKDAGSTRLAARSNRSGGGRRRVPTVSAETRRVMAESPPKRMLVTVGNERTQIAVLEERTLVEHYVTQASEQSYVGNIYKGRVQNVLPGMEAAFVDIGKGRNGVLYAGEVNYDEADRDSGLPRIEKALKPGQSVIVQVTKDPMGTKGARLTQHLSLAGRYCVLAPGDDMLGISRKLPDDQRDRLRKILKAIKPDGYGLIVRTAAETATAEQLEADVERLVKRWTAVEEKQASAKPLESIYSEPQLVLRVIRDVFGPEHTQLIINEADLAEQVREYLREVSPEHVDKVVTYEGDERLFDAYEVTTQIRRALEKKVWLKSGGYLIIEKTEAMWVIDVNTGKFVGKDNLEETVLRNNIEAAEEIARQLRLRDMGGIIVIDFVDMIVPANRDEVLKRFKRELARDKTKSRVMEISKLGLVQMTRKNVSKGLMEAFTEETDDVIPGRRIVEDLLA